MAYYKLEPVRGKGYAMTRGVQGFVNLPGALVFLSGITLEETSFG